MGSLNFNQLVPFTKTTTMKTCPVYGKNKLRTSFQLWMHVRLWGGSVPPPEHLLTPRTAAQPLAVATSFRAWPSAPSWHQKHLCIRIGMKTVPFSFLHLSQMHRETCRQQGLSTFAPRYPLPLHLSGDLQLQQIQTVNMKPKKGQAK